MPRSDTSPVRPRTEGRPTVSKDDTLPEREELMSNCEGIGALIIGGQHSRMQAAMESLQREAASLVMRQYLDQWLPRFDAHVERLQKVLGKDLLQGTDNLIQDLKEKVDEAGYPNLREFITSTMLPLVSYQGLLVYMNNQARVRLPRETRSRVEAVIPQINRLLGGACAAMVMADAIGG